MWVIAIVAVLFLALVAWRLFVMARRDRGPSRPIDIGHPHLVDIDPHGTDESRR
jgi:hypothetical protein